jgi:hypothetical protein
VDGVFSHVSTEFHYAGMDRRRARLSLLQFFESFSSVSLIIRNPQTRIEGDTAEMNVDADIEAAPGQTASPQTIYHHPIDITWTREIGRRMLVFPTSTWRITQITGPSPSADEAS